MTNTTRFATLAAVACLCSTATVGAQTADDITNYVPDEDIAKGAREDGWDGTLSVGANLNLAANNNVVGQLEGRSYLMGVSVLGALEYRKGKHQWQNNLSLTETWARTPAVEEFVKSNDVLDVSSMYNYFLVDWTGLFARLNIQTAIFDTEAVTGEQTRYREQGDDTGNFESTRRFAISDAFSPFTLNESVGWFAQPVQSEPINVQVRAGVGGRHTFADGVRFLGEVSDCAVDDMGDAVSADCPADGKFTPYTVLSDVHQAGLELFAGLDGKAQEGRLTYFAGASALFPFLNNDEQDRSVGRLTRVALQGGIGVGIFEWMTLNYQLKAVLDRQLLDQPGDASDWQVQHSLLLAISYTLIERKGESKEEQ